MWAHECLTELVLGQKRIWIVFRWQNYLAPYTKYYQDHCAQMDLSKKLQPRECSFLPRAKMYVRKFRLF